ncbi:menaquinol-cytochrome c reductase iron-sulfur subunit precursor [Friedmanniella luteola]|uniref:Cytochrome bc1 complex Rieske iron-sulfur subunit n=1 Tax=Friedmanniella luteola TaxID=546871 RepID=A0A1H1P470_9ACTN|nr:menaquinol-cytochrome c reductase iron-sulfur subunit precursor [Friedmanniella luteola]
MSDLVPRDSGHEVDVEAQQRAELETARDVERYPVPDPGLPEHLPRLSDVDDRAADRATRQVATMFGLVPVLAVLFVVIYFAVPRDAVFLGQNAKNIGLGVTAGLALMLIGVGAVQWGRQLMDDHEMVDHRHGAASTQEDVEYVLRELDAGTNESGIRRRKILGYSLGGALAALGLPLIVSFADLGPYPTKRVRAATIESTIWKEGIRLVHDVTYEPIKASEMVIGQLVNAQPENLQEFHGTEYLQEKAKASIIIVRMDPNDIKIPEERRDWQVGGILCYSKICTHVGCPISLWEQQTHHLLCPCHQSTFDLGDSGLVVFGPAARALPQLPITTDAEGFLVARQGFTVPVGPSYFERDSRGDFKGE